MSRGNGRELSFAGKPATWIGFGARPLSFVTSRNDATTSVYSKSLSSGEGDKRARLYKAP